ncbi:MAG TPA: DnaA/Hda family protein [Lacipirellula sp.]
MIDGVLELELPQSSHDQAWSGLAAPFVVGPENALLAPPMRRLLEGGDLAAVARQFNPLVLVGGSGSGKSRLVQAIVRHWRGVLKHSDDEDASVEYFTAADFGRDCQAATTEDRRYQWQARLRGLKLLVIEDLDRLRPRDSIQQELRHTIDAIVASGGLVLVTAKCEPAALTDLDLGLRDRLSAGLLVRVQSPGLAAREAILRHEASARRVVLSDEQVSKLARREAASAAELRGRVAKSEGASTRFDHPSAGPSASRGGERTEGIAVLKQIIAMTARYFAVTQAALTGPSRRTSLVLARNLVVHLARRFTGLSYAEIGRALGGRDHTTIMHADRRLTAQLAEDPSLQQTLDELDRLVR